MSFSAPTANPYSQNPNDAQRYSSWREAEPCPMGYGCVKTGLKWMTDQFDIQHPQANKYSNYLVSSIVGLIGISPLYKLGYLWVNGRATVALNDSWNGSGYADTPVPAWLDGNPGFGSFVRVYCGLETQVADSGLVSITGQQHPNYPGMAYAILYHVNWGPGASSIQNVEIEWLALPPALNGFTSGINKLYGANMIAATAAIMSHRRGGCGLGPAIDPVVWGAQAQALETNGVGGRTGQLTWGHPVYTSQKDTQTVLADLATYYDGFFPISGRSLNVSWRPGSTPSSSGLTVLAEVDHVEPPDITATGRDAMPSVVAVTYTEEGTYATRAAICQVSRNIASAPANQTVKKFDMPFFKGPHDGVLTSTPNVVATRLGQESGMLDATGTSKIFRRSAVWASGVPLAPGDLFVLNYAQYSLNRIVRIKSISDSAANEYVEIQWMRERGAFPSAYSALPDARVIPTDVAPAAVTNADIQPFLLPTGFGLTRQVAVLVQRPTFAYSSAIIWFCGTSGGAYAQLGSQNYWAVHSTLTAGAGSGDATIAITTTGVDMPSIQAEAALPQGDDTLLAIVPSTGEVLSIGAITVTSSNHYTLGVLRGRQGSAASSASNGADVWLVQRSLLVGWTNAEWMNIFSGGVYNSTTATKYFEVQPASATKTGTAAPTGGIAYTLTTTVPLAPTGLTATAPGGAAISLTWNQVTSAYLDKYQVQRATAGSGGPYTVIGYTKGNKFDDTGTVGGITIPAQYWYEVVSLDIYGNPSAASSVATATTGGSPKDPTPPQAAGAITFNANGAIVTAGDGTITSAILLNVPGLTAAAVGYLAADHQLVLYRVQGSTGWQVGARLTNSSATTQTIDLLAPGTAYEFALQGFTQYEVGGAITSATSLPYTSPNKGSPPNPNPGVNITSTGLNRNVPAVFTASGLRRYAFRLRWSESASLVTIYPYPNDFDHWNIKCTATNSAGATDYNADSGAGEVGVINCGKKTEIVIASDTRVTTYIWLQAVNTSEVSSNWVQIMVWNTGDWILPGGSLMEQQQTSPLMTGVQIGGAGLSGSASTTNTDGWDTGVHAATGGGTDESFNLTLPAGFSAKPKTVLVSLNSIPTRPVFFYYDYDDAANSSTNAVIHIRSLSGNFVATEPYRYAWKANA